MKTKLVKPYVCSCGTEFLKLSTESTKCKTCDNEMKVYSTKFMEEVFVRNSVNSNWLVVRTLKVDAHNKLF